MLGGGGISGLLGGVGICGLLVGDFILDGGGDDIVGGDIVGGDTLGGGVLGGRHGYTLGCQ